MANDLRLLDNESTEDWEKRVMKQFTRWIVLGRTAVFHSSDEDKAIERTEDTRSGIMSPDYKPHHCGLTRAAWSPRGCAFGPFTFSGIIKMIENATTERVYYKITPRNSE